MNEKAMQEQRRRARLVGELQRQAHDLEEQGDTVAAAERMKEAEHIAKEMAEITIEDCRQIMNK